MKLYSRNIGNELVYLYTAEAIVVLTTHARLLQSGVYITICILFSWSWIEGNHFIQL